MCKIGVPFNAYNILYTLSSTATQPYEKAILSSRKHSTYLIISPIL